METEIITLHNRHKIYNFILIVSSIAAMLSAVQDDRGRPLPAVRSIELIVHNFRRKSSNVCLFFVREFLDVSSGRLSFRFSQVFIKVLSSELNIFSYYISLHYYYARNNSIK